MSDLTARIFEMLKEPFLASFATLTEDGKPWVRYVTPRAAGDLTLRFATAAGSRKVAQLKKNPEVHLACGAIDPTSAKNYLQIQGRAEFKNDPEERHAFWHEVLRRYFKGPDDLTYGVVVVKPYRIEVYTMGHFKPEVWKAENL